MIDSHSLPIVIESHFWQREKRPIDFDHVRNWITPSMSVSLEDTIQKLFYHAESLAGIRHTLAEILHGVRGDHDESVIILGIKEIDLVRTMLLYEYELLDTASIISDSYHLSYYARRLEILRMTVKQIQSHHNVFYEKTGQLDSKKAKEAVSRGADILLSSIKNLGKIIDSLEQSIIMEKKDRTTH